MFEYNKYSNYRFEQICTKRYKEAIEYFSSQGINEEIKRKLNGILYEGGYDDFSVNRGANSPDNASYEEERRINFASLLLSDPKTFEKIEKDNILLFHGTNSNALNDIFKEGMRSESEIVKQGDEVLTGEFSRPSHPRKFISFTDQINLALGYATLRPTSNAKGNSSFGVLIGISTNDLQGNSEIKTTHVDSDLPEIGIMKKLPNKYIRLIAVPETKVQEVSNMVKEYNIQNINIVPAEGIVNSVIIGNNFKFNPIHVKPDSLIIQDKKDNNKKFEISDIKDLSEKQKMSNIKRTYLKLKNIIFRDREGDKDIEHSKDE